MNCSIRLLLVRSTIPSLIALLAAGCGRNEVKVYSVAKEPSPGQEQAMPPGHPDTGGRAAPRLQWKLPAGWEELAPGEMRVASFKVKGQGTKQADVSVIPLPGTAGGDLNNVNRWRVDQAGLQPVSAEELKQLAQSVEIAGQPADLYDVAGKNPGSGEPARILGTIQHREGTAWFFKMTGDDDLVAQQKPAFVEFLKSLKFEAQGATALPASHPPIDGAMPALPAGHPDISMPPSASGAISSEGKPNWQVPSAWKEIPGGPFLVAKFAIAGDGGAQAAVNVSMSAGEGGGLLANVNRWREQQLKLSPVDESELGKLATTVDVAGGKAAFLDMAGTDAKSGQPVRLVGAMVPQAGQTWFYKLMGDAKLVGGQKDAFTKFVQTVKY